MNVTNGTVTEMFPEWKMSMTVVLLLCVLLPIMLVIGLFGHNCKGGVIWLLFKWLGLKAYVCCCKHSPNYHSTILEKVHNIDDIVHVEDDDLTLL